MNFFRHPRWEFQEHCCSATSALTVVPLAWCCLGWFQRTSKASKAARWDGSWELWKTHYLFFPLWGLRANINTSKCAVVLCSVLYLASLSMIFLLICTEQLCQPKVCDFHMLRSLNKDIPGSKVTVHQAPFLQIVHALQCNTWLVWPRALRPRTHKSPNLSCFVVTTDTSINTW